MRTIERPHCGGRPFCLGQVHPDAKVCTACGAEKVFVNDGDGRATGRIGTLGMLIAVPFGVFAFWPVFHAIALEPAGLTMTPVANALVAVLGTGMWIGYGLAERSVRENRARSSGETRRHAGEASRRAEAAADTAATAASSAAPSAHSSQIHGRRPKTASKPGPFRIPDSFNQGNPEKRNRP